MAEGWSRQAMQIPEGMASRFTAEATKFGPQSVKLLGTAAVGMLLGMPPAIREDLYLWLTRRLWRSEDPLTPEEVWTQLCAMIEEKNRAGPPASKRQGQDEQSHFVSRILSPEVSLPPDRRPNGPKRKRA